MSARAAHDNYDTMIMIIFGSLKYISYSSLLLIITLNSLYHRFSLSTEKSRKFKSKITVYERNLDYHITTFADMNYN